MRRVVATVAAAGVLCGALASCDGDSSPEPLADVCAIADLDLVRSWYSPDMAVDEPAAVNDCSYADTARRVTITAERIDGAAVVTVLVRYADPQYGHVEDTALATWLQQRIDGRQRPDPDVIATYAAALSSVDTGEYPCSSLFVAGGDTAGVIAYVAGTGGESTLAGSKALFGSGIPGSHCSDLAEENTAMTTDAAWPVRIGGWRLDAPPGTECGQAVLHLTDVVALAPDGSEVALGELTMTNGNWMVEPPSECRRT